MNTFADVRNDLKHFTHSRDVRRPTPLQDRDTGVAVLVYDNIGDTFTKKAARHT